MRYVRCTDADGKITIPGRQLADSGLMVWFTVDEPCRADALKVAIGAAQLDPPLVVNLAGQDRVQLLRDALVRGYCTQKGRELITMEHGTYAVVYKRPDPASMRLEYGHVIGARINSYGVITVEPTKEQARVETLMEEAKGYLQPNQVEFILEQAIQRLGGASIGRGVYWLPESAASKFLLLHHAVQRELKTVRLHAATLVGDQDTISHIVRDTRTLWDVTVSSLPTTPAYRTQRLLEVTAQMRKYEAALRECLSAIQTEMAKVSDEAAESSLLL